MVIKSDEKNINSEIEFAKSNNVGFLKEQKPNIIKIAKKYFLDTDEVFQEAYEVLLNAIKDYKPQIEKDGKLVDIKFSSFFYSKLELAAMNLRNQNPEYKARQAHYESLSDSAKEDFKNNPGLLVQHLDQDNSTQESLQNEASLGFSKTFKESTKNIESENFFDKKLQDLINQEADPRKKAVLMQVRIGGISSFNELAVHFGVSDSRASQLLHELIDTFLTQRILDGNKENVPNDIKKLKISQNRVEKIINNVLLSCSNDKVDDMLAWLKNNFQDIKNITKPDSSAKAKQTSGVKNYNYKNTTLSIEDEADYPVLSIEMKPVSSLKEASFDFREALSEEDSKSVINSINVLNIADTPITVDNFNEVVDGNFRLKACKNAGVKDVLVIVRKVKNKEDSKILRIKLNIEDKPSKKDIYYAVKALTDAGFNQAIIASTLNTSRTNIVVYQKVIQKATAALKQIFEDSLIPITNASICTDFDDKTQNDIAEFISKYGQNWAKSKKFEDLIKAVKSDNLFVLEKIAQKDKNAVGVSNNTIAINLSAIKKLEGSKNESATVDDKKSLSLNAAELQIWKIQRENVIRSQKIELDSKNLEIEKLKREIETIKLVSTTTSFKETEKRNAKNFYEINEKLAGAIVGIVSARNKLVDVNLSSSYIRELLKSHDQLAKVLNAFRISLLKK